MVFVHAKAAEEKFVSEGTASSAFRSCTRLPADRPKADPAKIRGGKDAVAAMSRSGFACAFRFAR